VCPYRQCACAPAQVSGTRTGLSGEYRAYVTSGRGVLDQRETLMRTGLLESPGRGGAGGGAAAVQ